MQAFVRLYHLLTNYSIIYILSHISRAARSPPHKSEENTRAAVFLAVHASCLLIGSDRAAILCGFLSLVIFVTALLGCVLRTLLLLRG